MKTRANNIQLKFQNRMYLLDQLYGPKVYYVDKYIYIYIYFTYIIEDINCVSIIDIGFSS